MLHCGANHRSLGEIARIPTPEPVPGEKRGIFVPVSHADFVEEVKFYVSKLTDYQIVEENYGVTPDGNRFFGLLSLSTDNDSRRVVLGLRNAHDKAFPLGFALGNQVFVCDNLSFSADIVVFRRHTTNILRDMPIKISDGVYKITDAAQHQENRFSLYQETGVSEAQAHDLIMRGCFEDTVYGTSAIRKVYDEWNNPCHEEFAPRNAWSFFNCVTEVLKGGEKGGRLFNASKTATLDRTTIRLHGMMDRFCGMDEWNIDDDDASEEELSMSDVIAEDAEFEEITAINERIAM